MDRRSKIIIGIFVMVLLGIIISEIVRPKPLNWKESYTADDTIPFGCYVLFNELSTLFPEEEIKVVDESLYNILSITDTVRKSNYIMINNGIDFDEQEYDQLLKYAERGNDVFIASSYFGSYLSDTLNLQIQSAYNIKEDTVRISHTNQMFGNTTFGFKRGMYNRHFTSVDSLNTTILGHITFTVDDFIFAENDLTEAVEKTQRKPNFIKVVFGKGNFYLSTTPSAFSNFYLLNGNQDYASRSLSYLKPGETLFWDNYKKSGRVVIDSPLRFILNQPSLKWAYYLAVLGMLVFLIFKAKREQRIIPVIAPLQNSSIEFAKTVGSLYHQHRDYTDLISKKINYFLEHIRSKYHLNTTVLNERTAHDLAAKSGKPTAETKELLDLIIHLKNKNQHTEQDIIQLDKKITAFKN